jgi:hypothetical protein
MELAYKKLIADEKLEIKELPRAAQVGINQLNQIETGIRLTEKRGHKVTNEVLEKVKVNDKWVVQEILEYLETKGATPKGTPPPAQTPEEKKAEEAKVIPHKAEEVIQEIKEEEAAAEVKVDERGVRIDAEVKSLLEANVSKLTFDEMKAKAPHTYSFVFDNYEEGKENGVETSYHKVQETEPKVFTITKL